MKRCEYCEQPNGYGHSAYCPREPIAELREGNAALKAQVKVLTQERDDARDESESRWKQLEIYCARIEKLEELFDYASHDGGCRYVLDIGVGNKYNTRDCTCGLIDLLSALDKENAS